MRLKKIRSGPYVVNSTHSFRALQSEWRSVFCTHKTFLCSNIHCSPDQYAIFLPFFLPKVWPIGFFVGYQWLYNPCNSYNATLTRKEKVAFQSLCILKWPLDDLGLDVHGSGHNRNRNMSVLSVRIYPEDLCSFVRTLNHDATRKEFFFDFYQFEEDRLTTLDLAYMEGIITQLGICPFHRYSYILQTSLVL